MKSNIIRIRKSILLLSLVLFSFGCSSDKSSGGTTETEAAAITTTGEHGVGPVKHVDLPAEIDQALAGEGKTVFESKCTACHKFDERYVGPALADVTTRRNPAWIMNMIMNPVEMTQKDPIAKKLLGEYLSQMADQDISEDESRAILEYFRSLDNQ